MIPVTRIRYEIGKPKERPLPPRIKVRYPWDTDMTICIAALTDTHHGEHIVGCCDWRIETYAVGAETELKFRWLPGSWCVMYAGDDISHAKELCGRYETFLRNHKKDITEDNLLEMLRIPPREMRHALADECTRKIMAVSYDVFLKKDSLGISDDLRRHVESEVEQQQVKAELIIMGLVEHHLFIASYAHGVVTLQDDFAAIGSGSYIANDMLYLRSQSRSASLAETIYTVFEAKCFSEAAPGVGRSTHMFVMSLNQLQDKAIFTLIREGEDFRCLSKQLKKFAPRRLKGVILPPSAEDIDIRIKESEPLSRRLPKADPSRELPLQASSARSGES
jgi:hypothetical protein